MNSFNIRAGMNCGSSKDSENSAPGEATSTIEIEEALTGAVEKVLADESGAELADVRRIVRRTTGTLVANRSQRRPMIVICSQLPDRLSSVASPAPAASGGATRPGEGV
jgi:hypothetical protein